VRESLAWLLFIVGLASVGAWFMHPNPQPQIAQHRYTPAPPGEFYLFEPLGDGLYFKYHITTYHVDFGLEKPKYSAALCNRTRYDDVVKQRDGTIENGVWVKFLERLDHWNLGPTLGKLGPGPVDLSRGAAITVDVGLPGRTAQGLLKLSDHRDFLIWLDSTFVGDAKRAMQAPADH
jgi:hypothetical protein